MMLLLLLVFSHVMYASLLITLELLKERRASWRADNVNYRCRDACWISPVEVVKAIFDLDFGDRGFRKVILAWCGSGYFRIRLNTPSQLFHGSLLILTKQRIDEHLTTNLDKRWIIFNERVFHQLLLCLRILLRVNCEFRGWLSRKLS